MRRAAIGLRGLALAAAKLAAPTVLLAQDVIGQRQANYRAIRDDVRWINQNRTGGSLAEIAMRATRAGDNLARIPTFFPPGSNTGDTKALPVIWTDRATFDSRAADALREARALQAVAAAGNRAGLEDALRTLGASCTACHDRFRAS